MIGSFLVSLMYPSQKQISVVFAVLLCTLLLGACATTNDSKLDAPAPGDTDTPPSSMPQAARPNITLETEFSSLRDVLRTIGETQGGSVAVLNGIGLQPTAARSWRSTPYGEVLRDLGTEIGAEVQENSHYFFLYPPGYEPLLGLTLEAGLGPHAAETVSCAFGEGTPLFGVLAMLSRNLDRAIVADQILADTLCGEVMLGNAPLWAVLEAVLKSARLVPGTFDIDAQEEYLFLFATEPARPRHFLVAASEVPAAGRTALDRSITFEVAAPPGARPTAGEGAQSLAELAPSFSQQLGFPLRFDEPLGELPVNPMYLPGVRAETALDLLVRQWPYPQFGYRWEEDGVRIVRR